jgi:hypothetical protein
MQQFDITVPTVGGFPVHAPGRYIKYLSGNNGGGDTSLIVTPGGQGGNKVVLYPGQAYRVADNKPTPDSWTLANATGSATIIGKVVVGDGRIDDNTMSGLVQVVDGGKARSLNGSAFMAIGGAVATAGICGRVQLWNPASNPNRLIVEQISVTNQAGAVGCGVTGTQTQLGTLGLLGVAKTIGMPASVAGTYTDLTQAAGAPAPFANITLEAGFKQNWFKPNEPFIIKPGNGLMVWASSQNFTFFVTYEWYEEPNA